MDAETVLLLQLQYPVQRIDRAYGRGAQRGDHRADVLRVEGMLERVEVHAAGSVGADGHARQPQHAGDARVGVVCLVGCGHRARSSLLAMQLAGNPQRLKVGEGSAAGEMAEMLRKTEHLRQRRNRLQLHRRAGASAVERVVVGVQRHRQRIGRARDGMRRLQHLSGVQRVRVGIVVVHPLGNLAEDRRGGFAERRLRAIGQARKACIERCLRLTQPPQELLPPGAHVYLGP